MGPAACRLVERLCDGAWHDTSRLAVDLGVTPGAVRKRVRRIRAAGLDVESRTGRGYRLPGGVEMLDGDRIRAGLSRRARQWLSGLMVLPAVDSTNRWLCDQALAGAASGRVCLAEMQTAGRGRRGRGWVSPFGANVYCSVLWRFQAGPAALGGLSLAAGVAGVRALERAGIHGVGIKWPNDLLWDYRKLAGVLVEAAGETGGASWAVAGVGINRALGAAAGARVDQPFAELREIPGGGEVGRNRLAALLVEELFAQCAGFAERGFASCRDDFERLDLLRGRAVRVLTPGGVLEARAVGVDDQGRLRARLPDGERRFASGEVSLRWAS